MVSSKVLSRQTKTFSTLAIMLLVWPRLMYSHKKRKDSLEGSLDRVLFAAELEFL